MNLQLKMSIVAGIVYDYMECGKLSELVALAAINMVVNPQELLSQGLTADDIDQCKQYLQKEVMEEDWLYE